MGKVYVAQKGFRIILDTKTDLSAVTTAEILYRTPAGVEGAWPGIVDGTTIYYDTSEADLPLAGRIYLQSRIVGAGFDMKGETAAATITPPWQ